MERATGIEPASEAWEASILPMNYARNSSSRRNRPVDHIVTPDGRATGATCRCGEEQPMVRYMLSAFAILIRCALSLQIHWARLIDWSSYDSSRGGRRDR